MNPTKGTMTEILSSIVEFTFGCCVDHQSPLSAQLPIGWTDKLSDRIKVELQVSLIAKDFDSLGLDDLSARVESRLSKDGKGQSLVDVYTKLKLLTSNAIYHEINYRWFSSWQGDLFEESDSLERAAIVSRMEEEFGVSIPDQDVQTWQTVGQTVRYLWDLSH